MEHLLSEDSIQQSELEEFFQSEKCHPSSSSSSWQSLSMGSPENSYFVNNPCSSSVPSNMTIICHPSSNSDDIPGHLSSIQAIKHGHEIKFPAMKTEDMAIASAISAIFSSHSSGASSMAPTKQIQTCHLGFKPYKSNTHTMFEPTMKSCGQKIIKDSISYLRKINLMRDEASNQEAQLSSQQLQHMVSERKRREKLNESFYGLRLLLPTCCKVCNLIK